MQENLFSQSHCLTRQRYPAVLGTVLVILAIFGNRSRLFAQPSSYEEQNNPKWAFSDIQIEGDKSKCIAFDLESKSCVLDLDAFNFAALTMQFSKRLQLGAARDQVLEKALNIRWLTRQAEITGFANKPEIKLEVAKRTSIQIARRPSEANLEPMSDSLLRAVYKFHYDSLFAPRKEVILRVAASSDSEQITRLYALLRDSTHDSMLGQQKIRISPKISSLVAPAQIFPAEIIRSTELLQEGQFTVPTRTKWGWFVAIVANVHVIEETPFDSAQSQVYQLATQITNASYSERSNTELAAYWKEHPEQFRSPDTIQVKAWLAPGAAFPVKMVKKHAVLDTEAIKSVTLSSLILPDEARESLQAWWLSRRAKAKGLDSLSPVIRTSTGVWIFRVLKANSGVGSIPFGDIRFALSRRLAKAPLNLALFPASAIRKMVSDEILAMLYWQELLVSQKVPSDDVLKKAIEDGFVQALPLPNETAAEGDDSARLDQARKSFRDLERSKPMDAWIASLKIDPTLQGR